MHTTSLQAAVVVRLADKPRDVYNCFHGGARHDDFTAGGIILCSIDFDGKQSIFQSILSNCSKGVLSFSHPSFSFSKVVALQQKRSQHEWHSCAR
mmetsp:Transcript_73360/g.153128  ORF Transcript_73360/g.153128 Transcript_73360/m.153128 type:complete len:95 (-) Transcript_73360:411-695(-)